jgi:hypothetical protein
MDTTEHATKLVEQAHNMRDKIQGKYILSEFNLMSRKLHQITNSKNKCLLSVVTTGQKLVKRVTGLNLHKVLNSSLFI